MAVRRRAMEYRSEQRWGDLPVVHVAVGGRQADGRYRLGRARGIIALGDIATGLVAIGGVAIGLFSVGGVAIGLVAVGAVAIGLTAMGAVTAGLVVGPRPPGGSHRRGTCGLRMAAQVAPERPSPKRRGSKARNKLVKVVPPGRCGSRVAEVAGRSGPPGRVDRGGRRGGTQR